MISPVYDQGRADECKTPTSDQYNAAWEHACKNAGYMPDECDDFKNNPVDLEHTGLQEENRRNCYDDGFEDGENNNPFDDDRQNGCTEYYPSYKDGFSAGCELENTDDSCELTIEGHENYCPNNPDDAACSEFLHDASNKRPAESGSCAGMGDPRTWVTCAKEADPERYCLNTNDPAFCKTIGDICDADGFVRLEYPYCKTE